MLYAGSRERVENYPQVAYFLFSLFSSPLWLCSLKKKHKHPVLVRPIKIMGRRGRSNVHLVVIDYGHLVRQQPFHIMSDHKTPPKSCLCVVGCVCAGEAGLAGTAAHRPRPEAASSLLMPLLAHDVSQRSSVQGCVRMSAHLPAEGRQDLTQGSGTSGLLHWSGSRFGGEIEAAVA